MQPNQAFMHLCAFRASVTNGVANFALTPVQDNVLTITGTTQFLVPEPMQLRAGIVKGATIQRGRINTPSLRYINLPYIAPVDVGLTVASPPNVADFGEFGPTLPTADGISVEVTMSAGAPEVDCALLLLRKGIRSVAPGQEYRVRFVGAITAVAGSWAAGIMTPDSTLPAGVFAINGMDAQGTNLIAARLIFPGGGYRPGCLARNALTSIKHPLFTNDELGIYGTFDSVNVPSLEIYAEGANTAQELYLDLVRIGDR